MDEKRWSMDRERECERERERGQTDKNKFFMCYEKIIKIDKNEFNVGISINLYYCYKLHSFDSFHSI